MRFLAQTVTAVALASAVLAAPLKGKDYLLRETMRAQLTGIQTLLSLSARSPRNSSRTVPTEMSSDRKRSNSSPMVLTAM